MYNTHTHTSVHHLHKVHNLVYSKACLLFAHICTCTHAHAYINACITEQYMHVSKIEICTFVEAHVYMVGYTCPQRDMWTSRCNGSAQRIQKVHCCEYMDPPSKHIWFCMRLFLICSFCACVCEKNKRSTQWHKRTERARTEQHVRHNHKYMASKCMHFSEPLHSGYARVRMHAKVCTHKDIQKFTPTNAHVECMHKPIEFSTPMKIQGTQRQVEEINSENIPSLP